MDVVHLQRAKRDKKIRKSTRAYPELNDTEEKKQDHHTTHHSDPSWRCLADGSWEANEEENDGGEKSHALMDAPMIESATQQSSRRWSDKRAGPTALRKKTSFGLPISERYANTAPKRETVEIIAKVCTARTRTKEGVSCSSSI